MSTPPRKSDRTAWNWLLPIAVVIPLITPLYNLVEPRLLGIPLFYWLQLAFLIISVGATLLVYRGSKR